MIEADDPAAAARSGITLVLARADNGVIGRDNRLPWHIPADLKHFKALTLGRPMIMGRRTFESLPGLLPDRRHIVLTRDPHWSATGAKVVRDIAAALAVAGANGASVIGGAEIFALFLDRADRIELTEVHADVAGDTRFSWPRTGWTEAARTYRPAEESVPALSFVTLVRT